ncbi:MAG: chromosome assembly protein [Methanomicrobiales archaeon HGW-Methanomicrobiales-2]|nr:MAG: chromosome assembly protein [Methanomicrobiales archaeon HGW-Methanomicrobiales-5]PKL62275.1 MAG: chromosome assembly protein [Methanomicrobiales archaeon HGW-Methanomicrobiales-2]
MSFWDTFRKNPVDKLKVLELQEEEIRLKNKIERARKEINKLEKEKKNRFQEGVGADLLKKKMLTYELKRLDMEVQLKVQGFMAMQKQLMLVSNLVVIKRFEKELKNTPFWDKITHIPPEQLEGALINVNLSGKAFENVLDSLNQVFEMQIADFQTAEDETEKQLLDTWSQIEAGTMDLEEGEETLSIERVLEKREI